MEESLRSLQDWFASQCDGDWEHGCGVEITTLDNPGWSVKIDLVGTELEGRGFEPIQEPGDVASFQASKRWLTCEVKEGRWHGAGDETKLAVILRTFLDWAAGGEDARGEAPPVGCNEPANSAREGPLSNPESPSA